MTANPKPRQPVKAAVAIGCALFVAGLLAWLWLGDWRFALTGFALLLLGAVVAGVGTDRGAR